MKQILLTQGQVALVDDEDYEYLNQRKWFAKKDRNNFYVARQVHVSVGKQKMVFMHRVILNIEDIKIEVDHFDSNGLNNQRCNLRTATRSQNCANRVSFKNSTSKYKGVGWVKRQNKWHAKIRKNGQVKHLGFFDNENEAAMVYNKAALEMHGGFAHLNNIAV